MRLNRLRLRKNKVVVIGLDGTPFSLLQGLCQQGQLRSFNEISKNGNSKAMSTALPEVSSVAWTSFMTGKNPGKHGIYGFADLRPNSYKIYFPNSNDIKAKTLWDILGKDGKRSIVVNLPSTYPAKALNGLLVSGFVAIDLEKATYPRSLYLKLEREGYRIDIDLEKAKDSKDDLIEDLNLTFDKRQQTILDLMGTEEWDLFIGVITGTDRLHHFLWAEMEDSDSPYQKAFMNYYKKIDTFIGKVYEHVDKNTLFIVLSDHGFSKVKKQVYLNYWLNQNGYLYYRNDKPQTVMEVDGTKTKAFCMDPGRVYINLEGRFPGGFVEKSSYESLREELKDAILDLRVTGSSNGEVLAKQVYRREEIYDGPFLDKAPDLVVLPQPGWDLKGSVSKKVLADNGPWTGMHTNNNALFFINRNIKKDNIRIFDIAPTILDHFGMNVPADMEGKVLV